MSFSLALLKLVPIKAKNDTDNLIYMSARLAQRLDINHKQNLFISFGKIIKEVKVKISNVPNDELQLSETVQNDLGINNSTFLAKYVSAKRLLYLGPIIALATEAPSIQEDQEPHFGSIHSFCGELQQLTTKSGGFFYVFHYRDFTNDHVSGYYFEQNKWVFSNKLPLPDVVYNRIHSRRSEQTRLFKTFRNLLEKLAIPMFNDRFLSKWEVYLHLMQESKIHPYMPETRLFSQENLMSFVDLYQTIFIKPIHGSQGRNIMKLVKEEDQIQLQISRNSSDIKPARKCSKNEVFYHLKPFLTNRIYIIQQGIPLIDFESRTMDFRVLVHKNLENSWEVTSLVARVSAEQQFVSNLAKGGKIMKPLQALTASFNKENVIQLISEIKELSVTAAEVISENTNGITGELGIDIGVDNTGKPWIIEVNSKPSKSFDDSLTKIRPSAKAIIQFCTKLALDGVLELEE